MKILQIKFCVIALFLISIFASINAFASVSVFESSKCNHCIHLRKTIFNQVKKQYPKLEIIYYDLKYPENYQLLMEYWQSYDITKKVDISNLPIVFMEGQMLAGEDDVKRNFRNLVNKYISSGEVIGSKTELKIVTQKLKKVYLAYFYEPGCKRCETLEFMFNYLQFKYPELEIRKYNTWKQNNRIIEEAMGILSNAPENMRLLTPAIFVGADYAIKDINPVKIEELIQKYSQTDNIPIWEKARQFEAVAGDKIIHRFNKFNIPIILTAGVLDGINPCAFAVIIFLIIHLTTLKKTKVEVFTAGVSFISAVYIVYFFLGLGFYEFISNNFVLLFKRVIYIAGAGICFILSVYSIMDYFIWKKEGTSKIMLQLPGLLKKKAYNTIIEKMHMKNIVVAAFLSGMIVSFVEIVCTGQIYFPTILFAVGASHLKAKGIAYLVIYNLAFIVPMLAVFILVYKGLSADYFVEWMKRNLGKIKIAFAVIFAVFCFVLLFYSGLI